MNNAKTITGNEDDPLARLRELARKPLGAPLPEALRVVDIKQEREVFQPRDGTLNEHHVQMLVRAIGNHGLLDAVLVIQLGDSAYLIDGHHRLEAYEVAGVSEPVPVTYFEGTLDEAILEAGRTNSKVKLAMSPQDRQNFAWRLVRMDVYTKKQISAAASVSERQVGIMRGVKRQLRNRADDFPQWLGALAAAKGEDAHNWSQDTREEWERERAADLAQRLSKAWGPQPIQQGKIAAMALELYFGRRIADVAEWLDLPEKEFDDHGLF